MKPTEYDEAIRLARNARIENGFRCAAASVSFEQDFADPVDDARGHLPLALQGVQATQASLQFPKTERKAG
jgi:hypothetical protein